MSEKTHAEIIEEMRFHGQQNIDAEKDKPEYGILTVEGRIIQSYADRLEAAHKREIDVLKQRCAELNAEVAAKDEVIKRLNDAIAEEQRRKMATAENSSAVGNAAKLREAVRLVSRVTVEMTRGTITKEAPTRKEVDDWAMRLCDIIDAALAEPVKNGEVGTAKEQSERYNAFCYDHRTYEKCCGGCPLNGEPCCELAWAQMPYEEGAAK